MYSELVQVTGSICSAINIVVRHMVLSGELTLVQLEREPRRDGIGSSNEGDIDDLIWSNDSWSKHFTIILLLTGSGTRGS